MELPTLNEDQRLYIQTIFDYFHEHAKWPTYRYVDHKLTQIRRDLDIDKITRSLPAGLATTFSYNLRLDDEAILFISAICLCPGSEEELADFVKTLIFCVERYFSAEEDTVQISSDDLIQQLGLSESSARKVGLLIQNNCYLFYISFGSKDTEGKSWVLTLSRRIRELDGVTSIEQYFEKLDQINKALATPVPILSQPVQSRLANVVPTLDRGLIGTPYHIVQQGDQYNISGNSGDVQVTSLSTDVVSPRHLRVFLCHSSGDMLAVRNLYQRLKACNVNPWLDKENLLPGQNWENEIRKAVRAADVVIVCLSREAISKTGYVQKEIKFALDVADEQPEETIFLIPLKLEECPIPERLRHLHTVNYFEEDGFVKLMSDLKYRSDSLSIELAPISQPEEFTLLRTLEGHSGAIWSVAISSDRQLLASGSQDTTLKIWNLHTGELLHTFKGYSGTVYSIAISPDGKTIISGNADGTIKIWDLPTGELIRTLDEHSSFISSLAMSSDGQIIATGSGDNTIKVWILHTGQLLYTLAESVNCVAICPDRKILASGDRIIKIWDLPTGELIRTLTGHSRRVNSLAFSSDGQLLASGSSDRTIKIWNLHTGKLLRTIRGHSGAVIDVIISSDEKTLASVSYDNSIKIWNLHTGELQYTLTRHSDNVFCIAFSSDGQLLASGSKDTTIKIWGRN